MVLEAGKVASIVSEQYQLTKPVPESLLNIELKNFYMAASRGMVNEATRAMILLLAHLRSLPKVHDDPNLTLLFETLKAPPPVDKRLLSDAATKAMFQTLTATYMAAWEVIHPILQKMGLGIKTSLGDEVDVCLVESPTPASE